MPFLDTFQTLLGLKKSRRSRAIEETRNAENARRPKHPTIQNFFTNAQDFVTDQPNTVENQHNYTPYLRHVQRNTEVFDAENIVLRILEKRRTPGAEADSSERFPPPRCHPHTRKKLRARIAGWRRLPPTCRLNMLWLLGPAGVGKSALGQTTVEEYRDEGDQMICASYFFSRPNHRDDPSQVVATLVCQLMAMIPEYRRRVLERLAKDPVVLDRPIATQFKELLVDPLLAVHLEEPFDEPILVVLDGLDECAGHDAQCDFVRLISKHVQRFGADSPILWMVCSRPEGHLKRMLSSEGNFDVQCLQMRMSMDDPESREDVRRVLTDGLADIRRRFHDRLLPDWPLMSDVEKAVDGSSNLFIVVTTLLSVVGDEKFRKPAERFQECLNFMADQSRGASAANPFRSLDILYKRILAEVPAENLPIVMSIICLRIVHPGSVLCVSLHANVLGITEGDFYAVLDSMHSILLIPPLKYADKYGIQFHHASFQDFLNQHSRSEELIPACNEGYSIAAVASLRWYNSFIGTDCLLEGSSKCEIPERPPLRWPAKDGEQEELMLRQIHEVTSKTAWDACRRIKGELKDFPNVVDTLKTFDFCHLKRSIRNEKELLQFFDWLYLADTNNTILKLTPSSTSISLIMLALKLSLSISKVRNPFGAPLEKSGYRIEFVSFHRQKKPSKRIDLGIFFLGTSEQACLIRILPEEQGKEKGFYKTTFLDYVDLNMELTV